MAGALLIAGERTVAELDLEQASSASSLLIPIAIIATVIALALATQRHLATRRTLRSREQLAVVPADEFEPSIESVLRFAAQLTRSDRAIGGWSDRRASALRISLGSDPAGRLAYLLSVPERSGELLRSALRGLEGIEIRSAEEVLGPPAGEETDERTLRTELVLSRPSVEPLAKLDLDPDPLQPFAGAFSAIQADRGEAAVVHVDLLPAANRRRARLRRVLQREARRRHGGNRFDLAALLGGNPEKQGREPAELAERRDIASALDAKLRDSGPLFEAQILIRVQGRDRARAKAMMLNLLAAFGPMAARNWLRAAGLPILGVAFLGSDAWPRRRSFDRRFRTGLFRPARRCILTAGEVAGFLKPPTADCRSENVLRSGALLAPPPTLPAFKADQRELIPLGRIRTAGGEEIVGVRVADSFFGYTAGRSRYGKTEMAIAQFLHVVRSGHGGFFLDPHGDAIERIKPYLTEESLARRVVEISLGPGSASQPQPGWNLFGLKGSTPAEVEARIDAVVDAFSSAMEWGERNTRAINMTTQAATALAAVAKVVRAEIAPTIFQIPTLLTNDEWREAALPFLPRASQHFWTDRFGRLSDEAITPLTNIIDRLRASAPSVALLGQSQSTYEARAAMESGQIVLAYPGSGGTRDRLFANLLVWDLFRAALARGDLAAAKRILFFAWLDEIQSFDGGTSNLAALPEQTAKFGLRAWFLNQDPDRLSKRTLAALLTNRSHLVSTAVDKHAASLLSGEWGGEPSSLALTRLPRFRFIAQVTHEGTPSRPFAMAGVTVEDLFGEGSPDRIEALEAASARRTPTKSPSEVQAHLETLDSEILSELRQLRRSSGEGFSAQPAEEDVEGGTSRPLHVRRGQ